MKTTSLLIITVVVSIAVFAWFVTIWQYDTMMSAMMTVYYNPVALSLFVVIWTAGMAAMMFPAIIPMVLFYNRLIDSSSKGSKGNLHSHDSSQMLYHTQDNTSSDKNNNSNSNNKNYNSIPGSANQDQDQDKRRKIHNLSYVFRLKTYYLMVFILSYLAIWAIIGIVLLIGWSYALDILLTQLGINDILNSQQQQQTEQFSINTIYGILLIISGIYQFSSLKARCLGYCESPLSFFMRRWQKGAAGALKMGTYHGLYCLGCCWPYFLLMVALGWMNIFWMGLFAAIIFAEKISVKGGLWIARTTGICFISIGILSLAGMISLPSDPMGNTSDDGMKSMDNSMNMDTSSPLQDNMIPNNKTDETSTMMNMNM
jgi:predicted metal-binding membrane protein